MIKDFEPKSQLRSSLLELDLIELETRRVDPKILTEISEFHKALNADPMCFMLKQTPQLKGLPAYDRHQS
jgi:hypothetical protein